RNKGEAGTGDVVHAVNHLRAVQREIRNLTLMSKDELMAEAKRLQAPFELVVEVAEKGKLPVPNFAAGGIATPADAALCMALGAEAVFVGSGIFTSNDPGARHRAGEAALARCAGLGGRRGVARVRHERNRSGEPQRGGAAADQGMVVTKDVGRGPKDVGESPTAYDLRPSSSGVAVMALQG